MVTSTVEIKKKIISSIFDFARNIDSYKQDPAISQHQIMEMVNLSIAINNLIKKLDNPGAFDDSTIKPRMAEYHKLKRVLELAFKFKTDLNAIAMDIGEELPQTNRLLHSGIDYILDNVKIGDFKRLDVAENPKVEPETQIPVQPRVQSRPQTRVPQKKSIGFFPPLLFLLILAGGGYMIYNTFFDTHATQVSSLIHEYKADAKLSSVKRRSVGKSINVAGSPSLVNVVEDVQSRFKAKYPELELSFNGSSSDSSISALIDGDINLAASSRMPTVKERRKSQQLNRLIVDHKVAMDAVAIFVHPSSDSSVFSLEQLRSIYSTDTPSWKKFSSSPESGTHHFFKERVLFTEEMADDVVKLYDSDQVVKMVASTPGSIGYASLSHVIGKNVKVIKVSNLFDDRGVSPLSSSGVINVNAIKRGEYSLTRYLYIITAGEITDSSAKFIDFFRSEEVQSLLGKNGLVSIF